MKSEIDSIVVMVTNGGIPESVRTFTDSEDAEKIFRKTVSKMDADMSEEEIDDCFDKGHYDCGSHEVTLVWAKTPKAPTMSKTELESIIDHKVDEMFCEIASDKGITTGDQSPMNGFKLDEVKSNLTEIVVDWFTTNSNDEGTEGVIIV